jgi:transcriptional regulator with XRE-family HTH domain
MTETKNIQKILGENVRRYRLEKDLTQAGLAFELNMEPSYVSKIELGKTNPSLNKIALLAKALGCKPADLLKY